ncbi:hypothetical protein VDGD_20641 [Verticillium dahliae]|nr:hypothetical protein VDGD_20641 [Verticillium dahliae]
MLMASTTQSLEKGVEVTRNSESLAIKARVLTGINEMLKGDFGSVAQEVIRSVINLCVMEVGASSKPERYIAGVLTSPYSGFGAPMTACGRI